MHLLGARVEVRERPGEAARDHAADAGGCSWSTGSVRRSSVRLPCARVLPEAGVAAWACASCRRHHASCTRWQGGHAPTWRVWPQGDCGVRSAAVGGAPRRPSPRASRGRAATSRVCGARPSSDRRIGGSLARFSFDDVIGVAPPGFCATIGLFVAGSCDGVATVDRRSGDRRTERASRRRRCCQGLAAMPGSLTSGRTGGSTTRKAQRNLAGSAPGVPGVTEFPGLPLSRTRRCVYARAPRAPRHDAWGVGPVRPRESVTLAFAGSDSHRTPLEGR
jgi:hypothetical protein